MAIRHLPKKEDWQVVMLGVVVAITFGYGENLVKI
jgi:hypothetical protein